MKKITSLTLIFFLAFTTLNALQTENVFIFVIDGARYTETFGDVAHRYIPNIWNKIRPLGTIYTSFYVDGLTLTNPGHASIVTGTWQKLNNDGSDRPNKPTIFEYFRKQCNASLTDNYLVLGKNKLNILSYSNNIEYGKKYAASIKISSPDYNDNATFADVKDIISKYHPRIMVINFAETDSKGHSGNWNNYIAAIQKVDNLVYQLWDLINSDIKYKDKTTIFITDDHGRHTSDFTSHGDNCDGCRHIMLLIIGPDTPAGSVDSTGRKQIDIAPTIAFLMKFKASDSIGKIIDSAIIGY